MTEVLDRLAHELRPPLTPEAAVVEADRCLECGGAYAPAPCAAACPADVDVPSFVAAVAAGDPGGAARTIFAANVLGTAVDCRFWPLYEVVDGRYRLSYVPEQVVPVANWLGLQARFAHLLRSENEPSSTGSRCALRRTGRRSPSGAQPTRRRPTRGEHHSGHRRPKEACK
jgi:hypothetical protein